MKTLFLEIYIFILCINAGVMMVDSLSNDSLVTPFTSANVTSTAMPSIFNNTSPAGSLTESVSTNVINGTGSSTVLDPIQDNFFYPFAIFETFVNFLTGGFIWNVLGTFGLPSVFVIAMQSVIGFLLVVTIIYYFTGR